MKNLDETIKKIIQDKDTKQHHKRRKNFDETTKKNIQAENKKHQKKKKKYKNGERKSI